MSRELMVAKSKLFSRKTIYLSIVAIVIWVGVGINTGVFPLFGCLLRKTPSHFLENTWSQYWPGESNLSLRCPGPLRTKRLLVSEEFRSLIHSAELYKYDTSTFVVLISSIEYNDQLGVDLGTISDNMMDRISKRIKAAKRNYSKTPISLSGRHALLAFATFDKRWTQLNALGALVTDQNRIWQIFVYYHASDNVAEKVAQKVIGSIEIEMAPLEPAKKPMC
jgi:hypothetical protein